YCFVAWCELEQTEPGDTLTHTFTLPTSSAYIPPDTNTWLFFEPWGTHLTQYNASGASRGHSVVKVA
ncbi:unnamed protein product, partial [marine sediment metagenome]